MAHPRTAEESVDGQGQPSQWTDLSGPQGRTGVDSSREEDERAKVLLGRFGWMNLVRAVLLGAGGGCGVGYGPYVKFWRCGGLWRAYVLHLH